MHFAKSPAHFVALTLVALICASSATALAEGKLDHIGSQARRDAPSRQPSTLSDKSDRSYPRRRGAFDDALSTLFAYVVFSPWLIPHYGLEEWRPRDAAYRVRFVDYPYADNAPGLLREVPSMEVASIDDDMILRQEPTRRSQPVAARFAFDTGYDGRVLRHGFDVRVQFPMRLELDTDWSYYREPDKEGVDDAWLGREHLSVRFAESPTVQFRTGIGPQHLRDARGWVHGFDVTYGLDAFSGRPIVIGVEGSAGMLGKAFAGSLSSRIGFLHGPFEISAGWHQRWIGNTPLGGPFAGVRFWL